MRINSDFHKATLSESRLSAALTGKTEYESNDMSTTSIFLSHTVADKPFVSNLAKKLESNNVLVWLDEAEINVGDSLIEKISEGIEGSEYLGVVLSPRSVESSWVKRELNIALTEEINGRRLKVLPILYESCTLPSFLKDKLYADFTGRVPAKEALSLLLRAMGIIPRSECRSSPDFTIETLHSYLQDRFPDKKVDEDWNNIGELLRQLDYIDIRTPEKLDDLLLQARLGLDRYESKLYVRLLGGHSPCGTVRSAMWIVNKKAAMTCIAGKQLFKKYNRFITEQQS
jgi:hypothetical protein